MKHHNYLLWKLPLVSQEVFVLIPRNHRNGLLFQSLLEKNYNTFLIFAKFLYSFRSEIETVFFLQFVPLTFSSVKFKVFNAFNISNILLFYSISSFWKLWRIWGKKFSQHLFSIEFDILYYIILNMWELKTYYFSSK